VSPVIRWLTKVRHELNLSVSQAQPDSKCSSKDVGPKALGL